MSNKFKKEKNAFSCVARVLIKQPSYDKIFINSFGSRRECVEYSWHAKGEVENDELLFNGNDLINMMFSFDSNRFHFNQQ